MQTSEAMSRAKTVEARLKELKAGPGAFEEAIEQLVEEELREALREAPQAALAQVEALLAPVAGAKGPLWHAARGALRGALRAAWNVRLDALEVVRVATAAIVGRALEADADSAAAAKGAIQGAIQAAEELGLDEERAATAAATAAWRRSLETSPAAAERVVAIVGDQVLGIRTTIEGLPRR